MIASRKSYAAIAWRHRVTWKVTLAIRNLSESYSSENVTVWTRLFANQADTDREIQIYTKKYN